MEHPVQQDTTYGVVSQQPNQPYYDGVSAQSGKQKSLWGLRLWTVVQMIIVGVLTYALINLVFSMSSSKNNIETDTVAPGSGSSTGFTEVPGFEAGEAMGTQTVPRLDIPEQVIAGQRFGYTIARSTYSAAGVSAVYIDFGDGTRMEYVSGNAPNEGQYSYLDTGRYTATLIIVDADGTEYTDSRTVLVSDSTTPDSQELETVMV